MEGDRGQEGGGEAVGGGEGGRKRGGGGDWEEIGSGGDGNASSSPSLSRMLDPATLNTSLRRIKARTAEPSLSTERGK